MAKKYSAIYLSKCKVIQSYCIALWAQKRLVHLPVNAETARTQTRHKQSLIAVSSTSSRLGILGARGAIYSLLMPNMTEAGPNTFSVLVPPQKHSNTYVTNLYTAITP